MPHRTGIFPTTAAAAAIATLAALTLAGPAVAAPTSSERSAAVEANKTMVTDFYVRLFNQDDLSVIDANIGPVYIQHNPRLADGAEALRQLIVNRPPRNPDSRNTIERVIGERDLVLIHHHAVNVPGTPGTALMDVFRVRDGKIVEHWDVIQPVPPTSANGNDMFADLSPVGKSSTLRSKRVVLSYFAALTARHDLRAVDRFVSPSLIQHDPALPNGAAAVKAAFAARLQANPELTFSSLQVIADHDLVSLRYHVQNSPADLGQAVNDIYRVGNGKIVEQWNTVQSVPATSANTNTMF